MMDTESSVHPHRRSCGVSCHEVVKSMGGVTRHRSSDTRVSQPEYVYAFGASPQLVNYYRRVYELNLDPK